MSRDFKFRAWYETEKEMLDEDYPGEVFSWKRSRHLLDIMQYTGLKDKNGKEIYEGDIVKLYSWWDASGPAELDSPIQVVAWSEIHCGFDPFANYDCDCGVQHDGERCEVIGNIYENPTLLSPSL